jgi:hypothetical protein
MHALPSELPPTRYLSIHLSASWTSHLDSEELKKLHQLMNGFLLRQLPSGLEGRRSTGRYGDSFERGFKALKGGEARVNDRGVQQWYISLTCFVTVDAPVDTTSTTGLIREPARGFSSS